MGRGRDAWRDDGLARPLHSNAAGGALWSFRGAARGLRGDGSATGQVVGPGSDRGGVDVWRGSEEWPNGVIGPA